MSDDPEQCSNYLKIIRLLVDIGTKTARDIFYHFKPKEKVASFFSSSTICREIYELKRKHIISKNQFSKIQSNPNPDEFDLSLILALLTNVLTVMIDPPKNGWDKTVDSTDYSIGADLLRLREMRNEIIGHSISARINTEEFEKLWSQIEEIVVRLNKQIGDKNESDIKRLLETYKQSKLDPKQGSENSYIDILQQWCKELKEEVDDLWEKTKEFECFFENVPECYSRYVLLLNEGGNLVLRGVLKREELKQSIDIKTLLRNNKEKLKEGIPNLDEFIHDFEQGTSENNFHSCDLSTLSFVTLCVCKLSFLEKDAIETIKRARENYADNALASLDPGKFGSYWGDLKSSLYTLSSSQDESVQMQCKAMVEKYGKESLDQTAAKKWLGQLGEGNGLLKRLLDAYKETSKRLKDVAQDMEKNGIPFKEDRVITLKMITKGNRQERREIAENILYTVWQKALHITGGTEEFPNVKKAVDVILNEINAMDDVKLSSVTKKCVIVTFNCSTCTGLLRIVSYLDSNKFKDHMLQVDYALTEICNSCIHVTSYMTFESMFRVLNESGEKYPDEDESCICLQISCQSISGVKQFTHLFQDGNISNFENQLSHALSSETDCKINVKTEVDFHGLNSLFHSSAMPYDKIDSDPGQFDEDKTASVCSIDSYKGHSTFESADERVQLIFDLLTRNQVIHVYGMAGIGKSYLLKSLHYELLNREKLCLFKDFGNVDIQSPVIQYQIFQEAFSNFSENAGTRYFNQCFPDSILMCGICHNCSLGLQSFKTSGRKCLQKIIALKKAFTALTLCLKICKVETTFILDSTDEINDCNNFKNFLKETSSLCPNVKIILASRNYLPLEFEGLEKLELGPLSQKQMISLLYFVTEFDEDETKRFPIRAHVDTHLKKKNSVFTPENRDTLLAITHLFNGLPIIANIAGQFLRNSSMTLEDLIEILMQARLQCLIIEHQEEYLEQKLLEDIGICEFSDEIKIMIDAFKEYVNYTGKSVVNFQYSYREMEEATAAILTEYPSEINASKGSSTLLERQFSDSGDNPSPTKQTNASGVQSQAVDDTQKCSHESHFLEQKHISHKNIKTRKLYTTAFDRSSQADFKTVIVPSLGTTQRNIKRFNFGRLVLKSLKKQFKSKLKTILH